MSSRNLLNIILALVLAGLVGLVIYEPGKETTPTATKLTSLKLAEIKTILINQPQQSNILIQKTDNGWQIQEPLSIPANHTIVENFLAIISTTSHSSYPLAEIDMDQLRLTTPELTIQINNTGLSFGTTDALRGYRYVLTGSRVHLITDRFSHLIRGKLSTLISPKPLPDKIALTRLVLPELTIQSDNNIWSVQPDNIVKSADQIQKLLDEWQFAQAMKISLLSGTNDQPDNENRSAIEIHTSNNGIYQFNMITTNDEIILVRTDIGLRYHFDKQAGERLLGLQNTTSEPVKST